MTHEEVCYTPKEPFEFSNLYMKKSGKHIWKWIQEWEDNDLRNIQLDKAKFVDMESLSRDSVFHVADQRAGKGSNCLFVGWLEH